LKRAIIPFRDLLYAGKSLKEDEDFLVLFKQKPWLFSSRLPNQKSFRAFRTDRL
jgi:hypothetical protein